jgi:hypothetical protein
MAQSPSSPQVPPRVSLSQSGDGTFKAQYQWKVYRFLLDDGSTRDVIAIRDDSDLREAVLKETKAGKIEGVATVGPSIDYTAPVNRRRRGA